MVIEDDLLIFKFCLLIVISHLLIVSHTQIFTDSCVKVAKNEQTHLPKFTIFVLFSLLDKLTQCAVRN